MNWVLVLLGWLVVATVFGVLFGHGATGKNVWETFNIIGGKK
jgi:hypothetical protein